MQEAVEMMDMKAKSFEKLLSQVNCEVVKMESRSLEREL
jgi:hypothetical protein